MAHGTGEDLVDRLNLTPSPRLLEVLGDIPYQPWQCLAELIDNAFDDFIADETRHPSESPMVRVTLPKANTPEGDEIVCVADTGRGMAEEQLENALRAGYSEKSRYGSLGLFGMGFNIATARLGSITEVKTTRAGDSFWLVAEIDFQRMREEGSFVVPLRREEKPDHTLHGTEVAVKKLRSETRDRFRRSTTISSIRERLGDIYSYMLRPKNQASELPGPTFSGLGFLLYVNNVRVRARQPCVWSPSRAVDYKGRSVPAVIEINRSLEPAWACLACGHWHHSAPERCVECNGIDLELRERRVVGWVGIQRYLDRSDFGVDLLRNGRKIISRDKSLFEWEHPDTGEILKEYPIEFGTTTGGRLVGEVHLDHVPVLYQKNDFERGSRDWITAVNIIRGEGPMQPRKAKDAGYSENPSPLGQLYSAYRRNDAGLKCLIPGDGIRPLHDRAREWAASFRKGQAEYLTDEKWYEAAAEHDRIKRGESHASQPHDESSAVDGERPGRAAVDPAGRSNAAEDDLFSRTGLGDILSGDATREGKAEPAVRVETEEERFARYRSSARRMHDLCGDVAIAHLARRHVTAYETYERLVDPSGLDTPCVARSTQGNKIEVYVNGDHEVFRECGRDPRDYAILQLSEQLRVDARADYGIARVAAEVTTRLPDQRLTDASLRDRAEGLLRRIRDALSPIAMSHPSVVWNCLPISEKEAAEHTALTTDPRLVWPDLTADGRFVDYIGPGAIAAIIQERPDFTLDGNVFNTTWATWSTDEAKDRQVARLVRNLEALAEFMANPQAKSRLELTMARLTLDTLDQDTRWEDQP